MVGGLDGEIALVTGGASGIGRTTALTFARAGATVVVADIVIDEGQETVDRIKGLGGEAVCIHADVSNCADVEALMAQAVSTFGRLNCACNNAGIEGEMTSTAECTAENWDRVMAVNLKGVWSCMKYEIRQMLTQGGGAIVNIASFAGLVGFANWSAYSAAKGGVVQLTRTAAVEYAKQGIRINAVCPGGIRTPMVDRIVAMRPEVEESLIALHPIGRLGHPGEIAEAVVWLCSDDASFVTGHAMAVDGGYVAQ